MTLADRREREKEQRRESILKAAEKLFFSRGFDDVSVNDIAAEAEVNKALLYYYFEDKKSLYIAIVLRAVRTLKEMVQEIVVNSKTSVEEIYRLRTIFILFASIYPNYHRVYCDFRSGRFGFNNEEAREDLKQITGLQKDIVEIACDVMKTGISEGVLSSNVTPLDSAVLTLTISEGMANMSPGLKQVLEDHGATPIVYSQELSTLAYEMLRGKRY